MGLGDSDRLLELVRQALDEIDVNPIDVTTRRVARLASLMADSELAVRLGFELKSFSGHPPTNAEESRRLMADPAMWGDPAGPAELALLPYFAVRRIDSGPGAGQIMGHSIAQLQDLKRMYDAAEAADGLSSESAKARLHTIAILESVRHTCFVALVAWERQLRYSNLNHHIFERFRASVDGLLAAGAPEVLDQFSAVYRRLREAASDPSADVSEEVAQAVLTCRRILKAVADHLLPGAPNAVSQAGNALNDAAYKNRLFEYIKENVASERTEASIRAALGGVFNRFDALDALASKGVHAEVGLAEGEMCAIGTYLATGELLRIATP